MRACVRACVRACARMRVCACACLCMFVYVCDMLDTRKTGCVAVWTVFHVDHSGGLPCVEAQTSLGDICNDHVLAIYIVNLGS